MKEGRANDEISVLLSSRDGRSLDVHVHRTSGVNDGLLVRGHLLLDSIKSSI